MCAWRWTLSGLVHLLRERCVCHMRATRIFHCSLRLMDEPCLLLIMLYSRQSGARTLGFCFRCQSNGASADVPAAAVPPEVIQRWDGGMSGHGRRWHRSLRSTRTTVLLELMIIFTLKTVQTGSPETQNPSCQPLTDSGLLIGFCNQSASFSLWWNQEGKEKIQEETPSLAAEISVDAAIPVLLCF